MTASTIFTTPARTRVVPLAALLLIILALFLRLSYIDNTIVDHPIRADAREYVAYGYNIYFHHTFSFATGREPIAPDSFRSPGFPLLIAASLAAGGKRYWYGTLLRWQAILGTLVVGLTFLIGRLLLPDWAALTATALTALNPHLVVMSGYLLTETLFSFLLLLSLWLFLLLGRSLRQGQHICSRRSIMLAAACALSFGCTYLTNETALFLPLLLAMLLVGKAGIRQPSPSRTAVTVMLILFSCFPLGWNLRAFVEHIPPDLRGSQRALETMTHGSYPDFIYKDPRLQYYPYNDDPRYQEYSASVGNFLRIFSHRVAEEPWRYLRWYLIDKPYTLWTWNILQGQGDIYVYPVLRSLYQIAPFWDQTRLLMKRLHPLILLLALSGLLILLPRKRGICKTYTPAKQLPLPVTVLATVLIYYTLLYNLFATWPRYAVPLRPELYLWAAWSLCALICLCRTLAHRREMT